MNEYKVLKPISYAARSWNVGETVYMLGDRAKKYGDALELVTPQKTTKKPTVE